MIEKYDRLIKEKRFTHIDFAKKLNIEVTTLWRYRQVNFDIKHKRWKRPLPSDIKMMKKIKKQLDKED